MEFTIQKADFLNGLYLASGIADRKSTMPILANVLLRSDGKERIVCAATDLNVAVSAEVPARVRKEGGLTLGARHLHDIIKGLPGDDATLTRTENNWCLIRRRPARPRLPPAPRSPRGEVRDLLGGDARRDDPPDLLRHRYR